MAERDRSRGFRILRLPYGKKEWFSMTRHRGLTLALGLCALIGLGAREARAESIIMTVEWSGGSLTFDSMVVSPFVLTASSTQLLINTSAVDLYMSSHGSAVVLSNIGATSNFPGGIPNPLEATLTVQGVLQYSGSGTATSVLITTSESGFTTPSGEPGTLSNTQSTILAPTVLPITSGNENVASTASGPGASTGLLATNKIPGDTLSNSAAIASIPSTYSLGNVLHVDLTGSTPGAGTTAQFQTLTVASAIPEPASIILMLTGMPLPLVVLGLLRRRRAAA
jgi:hypothetical protein